MRHKGVIHILETIKSYLVSLGFEVDKNSYNQATKAIESAGHSVVKFAGAAVARFATAEVAVGAFVATAVISIVKFMNHLGEAQIELEKTSRQMWISEDSAMAFNSSLKALHANLQDLYLSPTLAGQFQELMKDANSLKAPDEFKNQMQLINSVSFEFKRMKFEASYAAQWIGYYFVKYMQGPILRIKQILSEINDIIIKTMPHWTKVVAEVMSWFARMGVDVVRAIHDVKRVFDEIGESIPKNVKLIGGALAALALIVETGPFGIMIALISATILLLDDFYTAMDSGDSAFGPFWKKLTSLYDQLKDSDAIKEFKRGWQEAMDFVSKGIDSTKNLLKDFWSSLYDNGTLDNFTQGWSNTFGIISDLVQTSEGWIKRMFAELQKQGVLKELYNNVKNVVSAVYDLFNAVTGTIKKFLEFDKTKEVLKGIGDVLTGVVEGSLDIVNGILERVTSGLNALSRLLHGDLKGFLQSAAGVITGNNSQTAYSPMAPSYVYPSSNILNNNQSNSIAMNPTFHIYGSDPKATADAAHGNMNAMYMRNMRGVIS